VLPDATSYRAECASYNVSRWADGCEHLRHFICTRATVPRATLTPSGLRFILPFFRPLEPTRSNLKSGAIGSNYITTITHYADMPRLVGLLQPAR